MLTFLYAPILERRAKQLAFWTMMLLPTTGRRAAPLRILLVGPDAEPVRPALQRFFPDRHFETADALPPHPEPATQAAAAPVEAAFDFVVLYDLLHHSADPQQTLRTARALATDAVLIKGHTRIGWCAGLTLTAMDWLATGRHGAVVPGLDRYWTLKQWAQALLETGLTPTHWHHTLALYPWPLRWLADRRLHCFIRLVRTGEAPATPPIP